MSHSHDHDTTVPPGALYGAAALLLFAMAMTGAVTSGFLPKSGSPELSRAEVAPQETRNLYFTDTAEGGVTVSDADTGETVSEIGYGEGGFMRASLRRLIKTRRERGIGAEPPFTLIRWENGALSLEDPSTGETVEIYGFGPDHTAMFAAMLKGADS
ncbi:MAG: photosynthetic complex assembly protein PuhC [Pseudomonadota bacterium]